MTSRAGSSFAAFPSFDVSAVSALAPGEPALSRRPAHLALPWVWTVQGRIAARRCVSKLEFPTPRVLPDLATGVSREEVLGDFTRVGAPRAVRYRARGRHGGENRIAGHREHLRRRVHWSFTLENN